MLKVIAASNGMFKLEPIDDGPLSPKEERLYRLIDTNVRIANLHVGAVSKLRDIADEMDAGALTADDGLKQAESVHNDLMSMTIQFKAQQFTARAIDPNGNEIDYTSHIQAKGYDIKIHVEDVPISYEKRDFSVDIERTLAVIKRVVDPDINRSRRTRGNSLVQVIMEKRSRYIEELTGICHLGLVHNDPSHAPLARQALDAFRDEFVTNEQGPVKNRYLVRLGWRCGLAVGCMVGVYFVIFWLGFLQNVYIHEF